MWRCHFLVIKIWKRRLIVIYWKLKRIVLLNSICIFNFSEISGVTFYADILGFDVVADNSNQWALFVSAGWYHHNFGLNVWNSDGATARPDNQYGLGEMTITLPNQEDIENLKNRLTQAWVEFTDESHGLKFSDPWNNKLVVKTNE